MLFRSPLINSYTLAFLDANEKTKVDQTVEGTYIILFNSSKGTDFLHQGFRHFSTLAKGQVTNINTTCRSHFRRNFLSDGKGSYSFSRLCPSILIPNSPRAKGRRAGWVNLCTSE